MSIVDRLRDRDAIVLAGMFHAVPVMREAADAIEALRRENDNLREMMRGVGRQLSTAAGPTRPADPVLALQRKKARHAAARELEQSAKAYVESQTPAKDET